MLDTWVQQINALEVCWKHTQTLIFNSQWGLSLAPARRSSLAMGTLLVMMAISRGRRPSLFGVLRSSSSKLYWDKSSCTKSSSWCSTASNSVALLWNCYGKMMHILVIDEPTPFYSDQLANKVTCYHLRPGSGFKNILSFPNFLTAGCLRMTF